MLSPKVRLWAHGRDVTVPARIEAQESLLADGLFTINNISFYNDADLATGMSSEDDWKRQGLYMGPAVSTEKLCIRPAAYGD